ncbi:MAG: adenylate/guanylate cyclase domain-containing protein, partial [Tumebacillaceae bacterium]
AGITGVVLLTILIVSFVQLRSIRQLRSSVTEVASGNWNITIDMRSRDEVGDLANRFNDMARFIRGYVEEITVLRDSYYRFVPQSFLTLLGKQNITEVELGDAVQQEASVLVASIRSFHVLSKDMTPQDNFEFINRLLSDVAPVVNRNEGMVNKFLSDGILALFPNRPGQALQAGIEILRALEKYNASRGRKDKMPVHMGIGINHGPMMLGIIGAEQRLEGSVISDAVNFATLIEHISEQLGANLLIPAQVLQGIPEARGYLSRTLGLIQLEGLDQAVELVDVFEADHEESRRLKLKTKDTFERAIIMYQQGRFYDAREAFLNVIKQNPNDQTAKLYFYIADANFQGGTSGTWNGTLPV